MPPPEPGSSSSCHCEAPGATAAADRAGVDEPPPSPAAPSSKPPAGMRFEISAMVRWKKSPSPPEAVLCEAANCRSCTICATRCWASAWNCCLSILAASDSDASWAALQDCCTCIGCCNCDLQAALSPPPRGTWGCRSADADAHFSGAHDSELLTRSGSVNLSLKPPMWPASCATFRSWALMASVCWLISAMLRSQRLPSLVLEKVSKLCADCGVTCIGASSCCWAAPSMLKCIVA
mmetsp:Transcript_9879/g.20964  ORF Transcript_9879/g.20964 Transcript_9879/m.20964 type:complete len:236 (+) Transcript_9879:2374-3081(+)